MILLAYAESCKDSIQDQFVDGLAFHAGQGLGGFAEVHGGQLAPSFEQGTAGLLEGPARVFHAAAVTLVDRDAIVAIRGCGRDEASFQPTA